MEKTGVITRRMTGIGVGLGFVALWTLQGWFLRVALTLLGMIGVWEVYTALEKRGSNPVRWIGLSYMALCLPAVHFAKGMSGLFVLTVLAAVAGLVVPTLRNEIESDSIITTLFPILYPGAFFAILLVNTYIQPRVLSSLCIALGYGCTMLNDVFAYEIGTKHGKTPLAPRLSPKKTVEGAVAGICASIVLAGIIPYLVRGLCALFPFFFGTYDASLLPSLWLCLLFGAISGVISQIGDLIASLLKRHCGIKDYGTMFPGHGGVMDRMDGLLLSGLCVCVFFVLLA